MKKIFKKITVMTSALAVMTTCMCFPFHTSAISDIINEGYQEFISDYEVTPREDDLLFMKQNEECNYKHIYNSIYDMLDGYTTKHIFECGEQIRNFSTGYIYWNWYTANSDYNEIYSAEEICMFLKENNLKAKIKLYDSYAHDSTTHMEFYLKFDEDATVDDIVDIALALYNEFGYTPYTIRSLEACKFYYELSENTELTSPTVIFGTPTIAGDIDMNGESGITDIVKLSKYTSNAELFPITDPTALANADVTQDGVIDSLDTNMLIEIALGSYESAV